MGRSALPGVGTSSQDSETVDFQTLGGHLARGIVEPTLELILTVLDTELVREKDQRTGLDVIRPR